MVVKRFEVYLVNLDPTIGRNIQKKTRPCSIKSPDEINDPTATQDKEISGVELGPLCDFGVPDSAEYSQVCEVPPRVERAPKST
jgi:PemK-like, MazF-like toxin of type II toxin-antitoxin system